MSWIQDWFFYFGFDVLGTQPKQALYHRATDAALELVHLLFVGSQTSGHFMAKFSRCLPSALGKDILL